MNHAFIMAVRPRKKGPARFTLQHGEQKRKRAVENQNWKSQINSK